MKFLAKITALASGWGSAGLCFSAALGFLVNQDYRHAAAWAVLGFVEVGAIL